MTLVKSQGYMNETGIPLRALADFYKVGADRLIIIHDELDVPFNEIRLKLGGGDNGHNGLIWGNQFGGAVQAASGSMAMSPARYFSMSSRSIRGRLKNPSI